jgi:hypothetical protein
MARKPVGTYTRPTADWFQHGRGTASASLQNISGTPAGVGLENNDNQGSVCHLVGVTGYVFCSDVDHGVPLICGAYYTPPLLPLAPPDLGEAYVTEPFFDLDPVSSMSSALGYANDSFDPVSRVVPQNSNVFVAAVVPVAPRYISQVEYYPPGGIAAFKPGRGFCLYLPQAFSETALLVSFDFVMLPD